MSDLLKARVAFAAGRRIVHAGDILPADDPIIRGREELFEDPALPKPEVVTPDNAADKVLMVKSPAKPKGRSRKA